MAEGNQEKPVIYGSELIDLSAIDLDTLSELPSTALRTAISRVRRELSSHGDESSVYAGFRSSVPSRPMTPADCGDDECGEGDALG